MYEVKANIMFLLKIATDLMTANRDNLNIKYYKEVFRAFKRFNKTGEHFFYKVYLSDIDLERFDIKYLFFQNELQTLDSTFEVVRIGDIFKEYQLFHDWNKARTFDDVILFKRFLDYDGIYNVLYVNKRQLKFLKDLEQRNKVKWYSLKDNKEEYDIVKRCGNFSVRNQYIRKLYIENEDDILTLTLKDVLGFVSIKTKHYGFRRRQEKAVSIASRIDEIIYDLEMKTVWVNEDEVLKKLFTDHLKVILYPLFQSNEDDKTVIDDYLE